MIINKKNPPTNKNNFGKRFVFLEWAIYIIFFFFMLRMFQIVLKKKKQRNFDFPKALNREDIVDAKDQVLATMIPLFSIYLKPDEVDDWPRLKEVIAKNNLKIKIGGQKFIWIKRYASPRLKEDLTQFKGVYFLEEKKRLYLHDNLFSHIIGFTDVDNKGLGGLELKMEPQILKKKLKLNLELKFQNMLRQRLDNGIKTYGAKGGCAILLDVKTGAIKSMVILPDFNPNYIKKKNNLFNTASLGVYEMGSEVKAMTIAMALDRGFANLNTKINIGNQLKVGKFVITDPKKIGSIASIPAIFVASSNIGTAKIGLSVPASIHKEFLENLELFKPITIELPEKGWPLKPANWSEATRITLSYGYGMAITPLHLVRVFAALAGDGCLPRLRLLEETPIEFSKPVIQPATILKMRQLLRSVIYRSTIFQNIFPLYLGVGGKTGTAYIQEKGRYNRDKVMTSFTAVFPIDKPKYVLLVLLFEPQKNKFGLRYGSCNAAPIGSEIIKDLFILEPWNFAQDFDKTLPNMG